VENSHRGMPQNHSWAGITHDHADSGPHFRFVAMNGAFCTGSFPFLKGAFDQFLQCVFLKFQAIRTQVSDFVPVVTKHLYHGNQSLVFPLHSGMLVNHNKYILAENFQDIQ
jgi:hypothetical protein